MKERSFDRLIDFIRLFILLFTGCNAIKRCSGLCDDELINRSRSPHCFVTRRDFLVWPIGPKDFESREIDDWRRGARPASLRRCYLLGKLHLLFPSRVSLTAFRSFVAFQRLYTESERMDRACRKFRSLLSFLPLLLFFSPAKIFLRLIHASDLLYSEKKKDQRS